MTSGATKQARFKAWLTENNAHFPQLDFHDDDEGCGSVYATSAIAEDKVFLQLPFRPLVLTSEIAREHLLAQETNPGIDTTKASQTLDSMTSRICLILFLIQQSHIGEKSFYAPYLDMIPDKIMTALEFEEPDLEYLKGTNAYLVAAEKRDNLETQFEQVMKMLREHGMSFDKEVYTWEKYLWAETIVSSRSFPAHLFGDDGPIGDLVLIPLGDSLNHKCRHKANWLKTPQGMEMSSCAVEKGEQVFNNYGPKSNEELLIGYGFAVENNPDDLVTLKPNFSRDPDQERKQLILDAAGIKDSAVHYLRHDSISESLFVVLRVMAMNGAEVEAYFSMYEESSHCLKTQSKIDHNPTEREVKKQKLSENDKDSTAINSSSFNSKLRFVGYRNEFAMLDLLHMLVETKLRGQEESEKELKPASNQAQEFAITYRQGQKQILKQCQETIRQLFSNLIHELQSDSIVASTASSNTATSEQIHVPLVGLDHPRHLSERVLISDTAALLDSRSLVQLKTIAVESLMLTAQRIMIEKRDQVFGKALRAAFPGHGWGGPKVGGEHGDEDEEDEEEQEEQDEMTMQLEQDAILMLYLILERSRVQEEKASTAATGSLTSASAIAFSAIGKNDYSRFLDEDMVDDALDLRQNLQPTLEDASVEVFDFENVFTEDAFTWAAGVLEVHSLSLHGQGSSGIQSGVLLR